MSSNGSTISVVIASVNGLPMIDDCLALWRTSMGAMMPRLLWRMLWGKRRST